MSVPLEVGVVIPLYNKERYVLRAIESVQAQTYRHWRLAVVDDGSTDDGLARVRSLHDARFVVINRVHAGLAATRNAGMDALESPWIALLDADDTWHPEFLSRAVSAAKTYPEIGAVFCRVTTRGGKPSAPPVLREGVLGDYFGARMQHHVAMSGSSVLLNREAFRRVGGFREDIQYGEDIEAWLRLASAERLYFMPDVLCILETGDAGSITNAATSARRAAGLSQLIETYNRLCDEGRIPLAQRESTRQYIEEQRARRAIHLARAGNASASARELLAVPLRRHTHRSYWHALRAITKAVLFRSRSEAPDARQEGW